MKKRLLLKENKCTILQYEYENVDNIYTCIYKRSKIANIEQVNNFNSCRELLIYDVIKYMKQVDKKRLRLLMSACVSKKINKESIINRIKIGCKIANIVSKHYKMQPVICKVIKNEKKYPIVEVSASPKWQRSPQMLSLFLLFTKYCNNLTFSKIETYEELMKVIDKRKDFINDLKLNSKKITIFLDNYDKFFRDLPMKINYQRKSYSYKTLYNIQFEGITYLFNNQSRHKILKEKFTNLLPKE